MSASRILVFSRKVTMNKRTTHGLRYRSDFRENTVNKSRHQIEAAIFEKN